MAKQHLGRTDYERLFVNTKAAWELFDRYLKWNGICGYTSDIIEAFKAAFEDEILFDDTED